MVDWKKIESLFESALDRPREDRTSWLEEACGENPELLREVRQMLAAHDKAEGILERPLESLAGDMLPATVEPSIEDRYVGPYRIVREIGRGGMGVVYQAHDPRLDRFVALKLLPLHLQNDDQMSSRFIAEAKAASALDHSHICTIHDVGESEDGRLYITMAYYEGRTLEQRIHGELLSPETAVAIALQIAAGLAGAHEAGIVHRDIKPSNIIFTKRGDVKILDFGVAKIERAVGLTQPGALIGTVSYMSPEQARGEDVDHRSDLWSLGVILYEMLTGEKPFRGKSDVTIAQAIIQEEPSYLKMPESLVEVVERALAKNPRQRYVSAEQFASDLEALGGSFVGPPVSRLRYRAHESNLPVQMSSFVGRVEEREAIKALLTTARLVTLTGPAGTGKSRLAIEVARELAERFANGVQFVPLASISEPALLAAVIAQTLGIPELSLERPLSVVQNALRDKQLLLILDNFEQIVAAASAVAQLLETCSELKVLVTSRVALRLSGEHEFPVMPLELPPQDDPSDPTTLGHCSAVELFVERARAVKPEFSLTSDNLRNVAELCRRLDGLPLAIELAAARTKILSPQTMLDRLSRRLDLLKGGPRDRPARHQTLRQAIEWSYDLLNEEQKAFFRRLSVFIGSLPLEAADPMRVESPLDIDPMDGLEALVDHSLLHAQAESPEVSRFFMLETIREYAWERLEEASEVEVVCRAHAQYFLSLAEKAAPLLTGPEQTSWLDRLETDRGNLHRALEWSEEAGESELGLRLGAALWRFWLVRGYSNEGRERLERILSRRDAGARTIDRARALHGLGTLAHNQGDNIKARSFLDEALSIWTELDDKKGMADELNNLAWVACELNDLETGQSLSEQGLALNRELGQKRGIAVALNNLGWVAHYRGDYRRAKAYHEESLEYRRTIGDRRGIGFALSNVAWAEGYHGDFDRAQKLIDEAKHIVREVNDKVLLGWVLNVEAMMAHDQGDPSRAAAAVEEALSLWEEAGNRSLLAWSLTTLGSVMNELNKLEKAKELLERGLAEWRIIGAPWGIATAIFNMGNTAFLKASHGGARAAYRESLTLRMQLEDQRGIAEALEATARIDLAEKNFERSTCLFAVAQKLRDQMGIPLPPRQLSSYMSSIQALESALGEAFDGSWTQGQQMSLHQGVALARDSEEGR